MLTRFIMALAFCQILPSITFGCVYNVRDVGFADINPTAYQLCYYVKDDTPQSVINTFRQASYTALTDSNVDVKIINVDQKKKQETLARYTKLLDIKSFPTAVLVSPKGLPMVLPSKPLWSVLDGIVTSPKREEILKHVAKSHSIVLLIQGRDSPESNAKAKTIVGESIKEIGKTMSQMPKPIEEPPYLITISPEMLAQERILLWSLGLDEKEINKPYIAILYGKGRQIGTLLDGEKTTVDKVFNILSIIGSSCECGLDRKWLQGTMIPLRWGLRTQLEVAKYLGFDPESPVVKMEISQILVTDPSLDSDFAENESILTGKYSESVVKYESSSKILSPAQMQRLISASLDDKEKPEIEDKVKNITGSLTDPKKAAEAQEKPENKEKPKIEIPHSDPKATAFTQKKVSAPPLEMDDSGIHSIYLTTLIILGCVFLLILTGGIYIVITRKKLMG